MGIKRLVRRRRATTEIARADASQAEPMASTEQEAEEITAAMVAGEPPGKASPAAAVDCMMADDVRVGETGMEAEESEEEDPVEEELEADEPNAADETIEADEDGGLDLTDEGESGGSESDDAENDEMDLSLSTSDLASEAKNKEIQLFIGGLPKDCVEDDIRKVFSEFGKIESIKIVKNPLTKRIKGFAFVRYANTGNATRALANLNEGAEVKGKRVHVAASEDNNTLYLGNICKTWTKDQVWSTLKRLGIEDLEMSLPVDPDSGGRNKGFAFVQFALHSDAVAAFHRLRKPDAIFGMNRSAKVSFAQTPLMPSEDLLMKVKTVYLEHIPLSWDEDKIEECCKEYGVIKKIVLFRKLKRSKKKYISFVEFRLRDNALACVQGINNAKISDGKVKVVASLARPVCKGRLAKQRTKGGYKVNTVTSITRTCPPEQMKAHESEVIATKHEPCKLSKGNKRKHVSRGLTEIQKASHQQCKGQRQPRGIKRTYVSERPAKNARKMDDVLIKSSKRGRVGDFDSPRGGHAGQLPIADMIHPTGSEHARSYQAFSFSCASGSHANSYDMIGSNLHVDHAGYIPITNHAPSSYACDPWRTAPYHSHRISVPNYVGGPTALRPPHAGYASYTVFQTIYAYPSPSGPYPSAGLQNRPRSQCRSSD